MTVVIGGGGSDGIMISNTNTITTNTTLDTTQNWMSVGPITINSGVTVTVTGNWTIV